MYLLSFIKFLFRSWQVFIYSIYYIYIRRRYFFQRGKGNSKNNYIQFIPSSHIRTGIFCYKKGNSKRRNRRRSTPSLYKDIGKGFTNFGYYNQEGLRRIGKRRLYRFGSRKGLLCSLSKSWKAQRSRNMYNRRKDSRGYRWGKKAKNNTKRIFRNRKASFWWRILTGENYGLYFKHKRLKQEL